MKSQVFRLVQSDEGSFPFSKLLQFLPAGAASINGRWICSDACLRVHRGKRPGFRGRDGRFQCSRASKSLQFGSFLKSYKNPRCFRVFSLTTSAFEGGRQGIEVFKLGLLNHPFRRADKHRALLCNRRIRPHARAYECDNPCAMSSPSHSRTSLR